MEHAGVLVDQDGIRAFGEGLSGKIAELEEQIYGYAEEKFNISSPKQLGVILFEKLGPASVRLCVSDDIYTYYIKGPLEQFCAVHPEITFERVSPEEDPDLTVVLAPAALSPFETVPDAIARVRISMSPSQKKLGDFYATQEKISYYDLLFKPSQAFARAKTCPVLKDYLASLL